MLLRFLLAALVAGFVICGSELISSAQAQAQTADDLVAQARALKNELHSWHNGNGFFPSAERACDTYHRAERIYDQLRDLLGNPYTLASVNRSGVSGGVVNGAIVDAARSLGDELDEEYDINDYWEYCPCDPPWTYGYVKYSYTGWSLGGEFLWSRTNLDITEFSRLTDLVTDQFSTSGSAGGMGLNLGYLAAPWNDKFRIGPFVSMDFYNQTLHQTFPGNTFIGAGTNWKLETGVQAGFVVAPRAFVYGQLAAAFLNEKLEANFGVASSETKTIPGGTIGAGFEYSWATNWSMFAQYEHGFYLKTHWDAPAAVPGSNFTYSQSDDTVKIGFKYRPLKYDFLPK
jgi:opacity protein-like surface antigen